MMVDTTVYGYYLPDSGPVCMPCIYGALERGTPLQLTGADTSYDPDASPLYYLDDDGRGLYCDECGDAIFEADADYCSEHDDFTCMPGCRDDDDDEPETYDAEEDTEA